jgi:hypothetical protein
MTWIDRDDGSIEKAAFRRPFYYEIVKRMADLPQRVVPRRLDQLLKHIALIAGHRAVPSQHFPSRLTFCGKVPMLGFPGKGFHGPPFKEFSCSPFLLVSGCVGHVAF